MNIVQIHSGLGNQMFQYAFFLALQAEHPNSKLDINNYRYRPSHNGYELQEVFGINAPLATEAECNKMADVSKAPLRYWRRKLGFRSHTTGTLITEPDPKDGWQEQLLHRDNCYFLGYWQTERYFASVSQRVREAFIFRQPMNDKEKQVAEEIRKTNSVGIHLRQGDYLKPRRKDDYNICTSSYYRRAIEQLKAREQNVRFFIFSDDKNIAETCSLFPEDSIFVDAFSGKESWRDMRLMSLCRHNIIANSSFSWWAAWLNPNPKKQVLAPAIWFRNRPRPDILPQSWIKIDIDR